MPHGRITETISAPAADVFRLVHDYSRRLEWDTLLESASLTDGFTDARLGATTVCKGRRNTGRIAVKTKYVAFQPPVLAAVKMVNRPPFLEAFAATIRHQDRDRTSSSIEYIFTFTTRPRWLRLLLNPIMRAVFASATKKRLRSLRRFLESPSVESV